MSKITIPADLDEACGRLGDIDRLLRAKRWERAAILATFVAIANGPCLHIDLDARGSQGIKISAEDFAGLNIPGLLDANSIREYVRRWKSTGRPDPLPGEQIDVSKLPKWVAMEPTGGKPRAPMKEIAERINDDSGYADRLAASLTPETKARMAARSLQEPDIARSVARQSPEAADTLMAEHAKANGIPPRGIRNERSAASESGDAVVDRLSAAVSAVVELPTAMRPPRLIKRIESLVDRLAGVVASAQAADIPDDLSRMSE